MNDNKRFNVADGLSLWAKDSPDALALAIASKNSDEFKEIRVAELFKLSNHIANFLAKQGVGFGDRCVILMPPSPLFFATIFALFRMGAISALIDPRVGLRPLRQCLTKLEPKVFIGVTKAVWAKRIMRLAKSATLTICLNDEDFSLQERLQKEPSNWQTDLRITPSSTAAILYTSGSTGCPKGAVYSHRNFWAQNEAIRALYGIKPGGCELATFPLFALFGPAMRMTTIVPQMDGSRPSTAKPSRLHEAIEKYRCTSLFANPMLLAKLATYAEKYELHWPSLDRVLSAGAPVPPRVLEAFCRHVDCLVHTPYGSTECLPVSSIDSQKVLHYAAAKRALGWGVCVGQLAQNVELKLVAICDEVIDSEQRLNELAVSQGQIGEIVVRAPQATRLYYGAEKATALAKIDSCNENIWHRMGDLGFIDAEGLLWMCGRKSHRVVLSEGHLFSVALEGLFNEVPGVVRTALVGVDVDKQKKVAQIPILCVEVEKGTWWSGWPQIQSALMTISKRFQLPFSEETILRFRGTFPVDPRHNAKIYRERLGKWAKNSLSIKTLRQWVLPNMHGEALSRLPAWQRFDTNLLENDSEAK